jgi:signal transduction histidine kinase
MPYYQHPPRRRIFPSNSALRLSITNAPTPAGEGTGLGLSISHDIIVRGGSIEVDTQPGEFTEIKIVLPRTAMFQPAIACSRLAA